MKIAFSLHFKFYSLWILKLILANTKELNQSYLRLKTHDLKAQWNFNILLESKLSVILYTFTCNFFSFAHFFDFPFSFFKSPFINLIHQKFVKLTWKNYIILPDYFFRNLFGWNRENGCDTAYSSSLKMDAHQSLIICFGKSMQEWTK